MDTLTVEIEIPNWVNWIAVDKDGSVFGYLIEPYKVLKGRWWGSSEDNEKLYRGKPPKNWKDELYTWG